MLHEQNHMRRNHIHDFTYKVLSLEVILFKRGEESTLSRLLAREKIINVVS